MCIVYGILVYIGTIFSWKSDPFMWFLIIDDAKKEVSLTSLGLVHSLTSNLKIKQRINNRINPVWSTC